MARRPRVYSRRPHLWRRPGTSTYYIVWVDGQKTRKRSTRTRKRAVAEAALDAFLVEDFDGSGPRRTRTSSRPPQQELTFHEGIKDWLADRERPRHDLAESTLKLYRHWTRLFLDHFSPSLLISEVTPATLRQFLNKREDSGVSPSTLKKDLGGLTMVFKFFIREGVTLSNPCEAIRLRARPQRHPAMTEQEYQELTAELEREVEDSSTPENRREAHDLLDLAEVLWYSGLRFIEATRLRWEDIDLNQRSWTIRSPENKGGEQTLPFHERLLSILKRRKLLGSEEVFPGYWHFTNLWRRFKSRHPEFRGWSWHRMRHAFITRLRLAGRDAAATALARHKSADMREHYTHFTLPDLREDLAAL